MSIKHDILQDICNLAIGQVQDLYPQLRLMYIPHESGRFQDVVATNEHEVLQHPAGKIAQGIIEKNNNRELSSFLGLAIHRETKWLGLSSSDNILAIFNINIDEFETPKEARRTIYHLIWHAIDLLEIRQRPEYAAKFRSGPMIPKRSPLNMARLNLQADVFSAVLSGLQGEENVLDVLAESRAIDSIMPLNARRAEDYPFVIALEAAKYAYQEIVDMKPLRTKYMSLARQLAHEIGHTFDDKSIRRWWRFSEPAQDMAFRNMPPEMILGCSVYTSEDAFVRATAHLVMETSNIEPLSGLKLNGSYNAYTNQQHNQVLHRELMEKTFEEAIARGVQEESGQPLIVAANAQNENLAEGNIIGWCAHALQAAARAFDGAASLGVSPAQAARLEFEGTKESTPWDTLKKIGETVVEKNRQGLAVTMGSIAEVCNSNPAFAQVLGSVRVTMKDPSYIAKLQAANDLSVPGLLPRAPTPKAQPSSAPSYTGPAPSAPGMGLGGGSSNAAARHHAIMEKLRNEKKGDEEQK